MPKPNLFLIPGWAVNSSIWQSVHDALSETFDLHYYDFPGYGRRQSSPGNLTLEQLVDDALQQSPADAVWLAWSLGTMVALEAARQSPDLISQLILTCPTPKFMIGDDWSHGQTEAAMDNLQQRFETDYQTAIKRFLLLQAGTDATARKLAKETVKQLAQYPDPEWQTLNSGLEILRHADLRPGAGQVTVATRIIVGQEDRVIPAAAGQALHQMIPQSTLWELPSGHAPMIETPDPFVFAVSDRNES